MSQEKFYVPTETRLPMTPKKSTSLLGYILLFLVIFSILGMGAYFVLTTFFGYEFVLTKKNKAPMATVMKTPQITPAGTIAPTTQPTPTVAIPTLTSIDETWNLYTNNNLGFSMQLPKTSIVYAGKCVYMQKNDHSFRLFDDVVPVVALDSRNGVYITGEYFFEPAGETKEKNISYYSTCDKTAITASLLDERRSQTGPARKFTPSSWLVNTKPVADEAGLLQFVKDNYGEGCSLGVKKADSNGSFDVKIVGDLGKKTLEDATCPINFMYALKYSPKKKMAATWTVGQEVTFSGINHKPAYDNMMINSFKFQ